MMPICNSCIDELIQQYRIAAIQGIGIVFVGNFSGLVTGLALSPPPSIDIPKVIVGSLFGGFVGISIALTLIFKKTREFINHESN
ncbi:MAG: hypothetical protein AAF378_20580 [Cyanobacteria bacterium P01_A01_bin.84]